MLIPILIFDVALVAWSLHLMQESFHKREFSLLLAGLLVSLSAGALMVVYFLMNHCMSSLAQMG
ncbi:MAG: hypothetical protein J7647_16640 [Cyanobacteria bacterium SBLK]|jgi:hypothetical protein|nr:hypothetical protein [Cyanobacteria bacterium SBLK]